MSFQARVVSGFLAICLVLPIIWWKMPTPEARTAERMKSVALSLPLGSTPEQVKAALQKQAVEFVYHRVEGEFVADSRISRAGYAAADLGSYAVTYVHGTPRSLIGSCSVMRYFLFDKKGKLIQVLSDEGCVSL